jgi:hydroxymethylbilane synthase
MHIRIATRKSLLAITQAELIASRLQALDPSVTTSLVRLTSEGDQIQHQMLSEHGGKGLFVKRLEEALLANEADIAMHSLKDVPPVLDERFHIPAVLQRDPPGDAFISSYVSLMSLPLNAKVGTCSVRRRAAMLHRRPDLQPTFLRGNIDTRLQKLTEGAYDAIILAEAGLQRLGRLNEIKERLPLHEFVPSAGQGVVAVESLRLRTDLLPLLNRLNHSDSFDCITAERAMNQFLEGGCSSPIGSYATLAGDSIKLQGVVWSQDGKVKISAADEAPRSEAFQLGQRVAQKLLAQGARVYLV